jgi:hypothetical protein
MGDCVIIITIAIANAGTWDVFVAKYVPRVILDFNAYKNVIVTRLRFVTISKAVL